MTKDQAIAKLTEAGLQRPRIMNHLKRDGSVVWEIYAGPHGARVKTEVPKNASDADLTAAVERMA